MKKEEIVSRILDRKIIAIVRLALGSNVDRVVEQLVLGGIDLLEVTSNTPNYLQAVSAARRIHPQSLVGAGTITDGELARQAIGAGAQFLVTPNTSQDVIEVASTSNIPVIMGALTPTEVAHAISYGADLVKLFPAGPLGIDYFKAVKGPFSRTRFIAVGGIGLHNLQDWLEAGIDGLGIGSTLVNAEIKTEEQYERIATQAQQFKKALANYEDTANRKH